MAIHPGDILGGYQVTQLLGRGGMGEVWGAQSPDGQREVAIKVLLPTARLKRDLVARFEREATVTAAIESDYVCKLLEYKRDDNDALLLIFELLRGESLAQRLNRELYLSFADVGPIVDDVLQGLAAAHSAGVIHRDLKPGNIFLEYLDSAAEPERAKILDFGISKLTDRQGMDEPSLTDFDATLGSFAYMAPEQVRNAARVDKRADIYALGAVAFRALAGRLPFEGTNAGMIIGLKLDRDPPTLSSITGDHWPAGLERFVACALQRDPDRRFADAHAALSEWRQVVPVSSRHRMARPPNARPYSGYDTSIDAPHTMTETSAPIWDGAPTATEVGDGFDRN